MKWVMQIHARFSFFNITKIPKWGGWGHARKQIGCFFITLNIEQNKTRRKID